MFERAALATRGAQLEDEIYEVRDLIITLESDVLNFATAPDNDSVIKISELKVKLQDLKLQYLELIGGESLPLYFGNMGKDSS